MLLGTRDDDVVVLAGSPHAHIRARWIPARPCPCLLDPRTHTLTGCARTHACTGPMHACSHRVPTPTRSQGPCTHACTGSPRLLARGAHLARSHRVPMPARSRGPHASTHWANHARSHWAMHARSHRAMPARSHRAMPARSHRAMHARSVSMHACTRAYARALALGPHARSLAGFPCTCAGSLHSCMLHPILYVVVVICSSSTVCILV